MSRGVIQQHPISQRMPVTVQTLKPTEDIVKVILSFIKKLNVSDSQLNAASSYRAPKSTKDSKDIKVGERKSLYK